MSATGGSVLRGSGTGTGDGFDVCVLGSFMKDLVAVAPRRPRAGETVRGHAFEEFLGGKGVNQAVAAARCGARTAMVGRLGADRHGDEFVAMLSAEGIDARGVVRDPARGTGVGLPVVEPDGANSIVVVPRANDAVDIGQVERAAPVIRASRVLLVQLELPPASALAALRIARAAGVLTILNPAPYAELPDALADVVDVLIPNEVEAGALAGRPCDDDHAVEVARSLCRRMARRGAVLTLGGRGAIVVDADHPDWRTDWLTPHQVPVLDTVGAGDAFCGALAAGLAAGRTLLDAARYANAAGALATTRRGAVPAMPNDAQVRALLDGDVPTSDAATPVAVAADS